MSEYGLLHPHPPPGLGSCTGFPAGGWEGGQQGLRAPEVGLTRREREDQRWREEKPVRLHRKNKGSRAVERSHQGIGHGEKTLGIGGGVVEAGRKESGRKTSRPARGVGAAEASARASAALLRGGPGGLGRRRGERQRDCV